MSAGHLLAPTSWTSESLTDPWRVRHDEEGLPVITRLMRKTLRQQLPAGWRWHQVGDDGANLLAPVGDFDIACGLIQAYRRRQKTGGRNFVCRVRDREPLRV
jgi:hypothetical protein